MSDFSKFLEIRKAYAKLLPAWLEHYDRTGDMRQDPYFMDWEFTPIEQNVWGDIRTLGLPFFPQVPVLNYFIDFGNPFLKIGIECDGKAWHDYDLDRARDARLAAAGWTIFRIEGHECKRVVTPDFENEDADPGELVRYYSTTSEGILTAIKRKYFDRVEDDFRIEATLFDHRSTPEMPIDRRTIVSDRGPVLFREMMPAYLDLIVDRIERNAA